jgi:hypothetical protein
VVHSNILKKKPFIVCSSTYLNVGASFEFFPPNLQMLTVVEPNTYFETWFYKNQSKQPTVKIEKFVVAPAVKVLTKSVKSCPSKKFENNKFFFFFKIIFLILFQQ